MVKQIKDKDKEGNSDVFLLGPVLMVKAMVDSMILIQLLCLQIIGKKGRVHAETTNQIIEFLKRYTNLDYFHIHQH